MRRGPVYDHRWSGLAALAALLILAGLVLVPAVFR